MRARIQALGRAIGVYVEQTFATESSSVAKGLPEVFQRFVAADFVDPAEVQPDYLMASTGQQQMLSSLHLQDQVQTCTVLRK